jgi:hypothetical protein
VYCIVDPGATQLGEIDAEYFRTVDVFAPAICPSAVATSTRAVNTAMFAGWNLRRDVLLMLGLLLAGGGHEDERA